MTRISQMFARLKQEGRVALMPYLMTGFPERDSAPELALVLQEAGADLFEFGVPFSDPLADGATVQRASERALKNGVRLRDTVEQVATMRSRGVTVPLVPMGYYNPFLQYGIERLTQDMAQAGADGLIIPDLPPEEAEPVHSACRTAGLDLVFFVAPTTPDERIAQIARLASGFIYCVALTGVTGARSALWSGLPDFLARVRSHTDVPLVVGFGISTPEHVAEVGKVASGAIVASALINVLEAAAPAERTERAVAYVRSLRP
jgi:tryptophan synthase alpha chain